MTTNHGIDLVQLSYAQLQQLRDDVHDELTQRENEDRAVLEERLRALCEEHGFPGTAVRLAANGRRAARRTRNGKETDHE